MAKRTGCWQNTRRTIRVATGDTAACPRMMEPKVQVSRITVGDDVFAYVDVGVGPPVLFLHGALGDLRTWKPHVAALSKRFRCLAYTQRWFGIDPWREDGPAFGVATHADDLIAFIAAVGVGPVHLVAWSYAGHIALHAALRTPKLFSSLVLFDPGVQTFPLAPDEQNEVGNDAQTAFTPIFKAVGRGDYDYAVRHLIDASGVEGHFRRQSAEQRAIQLENAHTMPLLLNQQAPPMLKCADVASLKMPVTIYWGGNSRPTFRLPAIALARCISGHHREIPNVGHLWPIEDVDGFTDQLEDALPPA